MLHKVSNALVESTNTKLRVLHRMAFGFRDPEHLIAPPPRCPAVHLRRLRRFPEPGPGGVPGGVNRPVCARRLPGFTPSPRIASRSARGRALKRAMKASTAAGSSGRTPSAAASVHRR